MCFSMGVEMLLAIDQGNTNTKYAIHDGVEWIAQWRTATDSMWTADEYAVWLSQAMGMRQISVNQLTACIISSVVPQSLFNLRNLSRRYLHAEPYVVGENVHLGIEVRIDKPSEAGADRLLLAVGAHVAFPGPLLVVGSGTATTFDVIAADGAFEGGAIAPGINLSMQALHSAAARLPRIAIRKPDKVIGTDTVSSMQTGVYWGYVALIEGLIDRIKDEYGEPMTVIATGGVASLFAGATAKIDVFDADVAFRGLLELYNRNRHTPARA
jgi:type III pantothenate kinase